MFPGGGQPNMQEMLQQAQKMQQDLANAQEELAQSTVDGTAGGGLVKATVSGVGELQGLTIDPSAVGAEAGEPEEISENLADLVLAAVREANRAAQEVQEQKLGPLKEMLGGAGGAGGPGGATSGPSGIPGMPGM